jgi:hypothetical protein
MRVWLLAGLALASLSQVSKAQPVGDTVARVRACLKYESAARQECFDTLWHELTRDHLAPAAPPSAPTDGSWVVSATMSPLDYSPQVIGTKVARSASAGAPSHLTLACRGRRTEISIGTAGTWRPSTGEDVLVVYRISGQPEVQERWSVTAGGRSAVYRGDGARLLSVLPDPGQVAIRVQDRDGPSAQTTFDLAGVDAVRQKITGACRPPSVGAGPPEWR